MMTQGEEPSNYGIPNSSEKTQKNKEALGEIT